MPSLASKGEMNNEENEELDLTTTIKSDLAPPTETLSSTPSFSIDSLSNEAQDQAPRSLLSRGIINTRDKSHSIASEKIVKKVRLSEESIQKKEYRNVLDRPDVQQQIRASIASLPGDMQFSQSIEFSRKRSWIFSKLSFFSKYRKSNEPVQHSLKLFDIYKYADRTDIALMIIGAISALAVGAGYPIVFYLYSQMLDSFTDFNNQQNNVTSNSSNSCVTISNTTKTISPSENIKQIINYYVILGFLTILFSWIAWTSWIIAAERQIRRIRFNLFRNILRQEIGWFDLHNAGELSSRLVSDLDKMKDGMGEKVPDFIALFARMIGSLIYSLVTGWKLTLVYLSISPLLILIFNLTIKTIVLYTMKEVQAFASASAVVHEVLQNLRTVTAFNGQEKEKDRFANNLIDAKIIGIKKGIYVGLCQGINALLSYSAFAIVVWYGPYLARTECSIYSAGSVIAVFYGVATATTCISQFIPNIQNFAEAAGSGVHILEIIKRQTKIDASSDEGEKPETMTGHIAFRHVNFAYPSRDETSVLSNLSLEIPAGKTVALVGPSGCGKTTTIQLIQRFYDPDGGQILLDGKDIRTLNVAWLRSHIGIVSQEPVLFSGSIEENIRFGKPNATDEEVQNAAKMANAHEFIMTLPENYKTTSGDKLSGGQKQRVAIARALISNPKILLLDEATSALDNTSERIVQDALEKAKQGRTTIVIAHRLSTIRNVDLIIGLDHGEVVECGSHDLLMEQKGLYYELVTAQTDKEEEKDDESDSESEGEDDSTVDLAVPEIAVDRRISRMSIFSIGSDGFDDHDSDSTADNHFGNKRWFRTPFLYKIAKFNAPEWRWILLGTVVSTVFGAVGPLYGLIFSNLYSSFGEQDIHKQEKMTRTYAVLAFVIGLSSGIVQFLISLSFAKSGEALTMRMRKLTFSAILRQEMSYFDQECNSTSAVVTRLSSDASALKGLTGVRIGIILQSISAAVLGIILGFAASWKLSLIIMCFSPVLLLSTKIRVQKTPYDKESEQEDSLPEQSEQHALQAIEHIRTVVALHRENHFIDLYEQTYNREFQKQTRLAHLTAIGLAVTNSSLYFLYCTCFGYGRVLVANGELQYTQMFKVFAVVTMAIFSVTRCIAIIPDYSKAKAAAIRIMKLDKRESQIDPTDESGIVLDHVVGDIKFRDIGFRYLSRPTVHVLRHFTLQCASSQTTALVGPSGSGKSTAIALLQRFYDSRKGKILLDGHDIKVLNIRWLRSLMGVVQQEPVLFNLSIRENIAYGDTSRQVTDEEIETAARMANIHDLIISLPQGYDTLCGAKGNQLSGGQKQRIAIARALIRNPKILLLDEATSALDNKSEQVVQGALDQAQIGRTCLTIAHRLTTIKNSAKIAVVKRGKMTEEGTHEQLLRQDGTYARLMFAQERTIKD